MEYLCLDIKYIYVHADKRNYYLLTILDVFSRKTVDQIFQKSIRQIDVINAFRRINQQYGIKGVTIRNDNGSQLSLIMLSSISEQQKPTRNSHILPHRKKTLISKLSAASFNGKWLTCEFDSFYHAKHALAAHRNWYDNKRRHRNIGMTPLQKWEQNIYITERKRAERKELQDILETASELAADIDKYDTTSSLLLSN